MKVSRKIAVFGSLVLGIAGLLLGLRSYEKHLAEQKGLLQLANEACAKAEQSDVPAEFELGRMYYFGSGPPKDYGEAIRWFRKAADQEYPKAEFNLGQMYHQGEGVIKDYAEARRWLQMAADQG